MKRIRLARTKSVRYTMLALLFLGILVCRFNEGCGEWYARHIYPLVSAVLSTLSRWIPFSLEEVLVVGGVIGMVAYPFLVRRKKTMWQIVCGEVEFVLWIFVWFYWGWGMNYFRYSFFQRVGVKPLTYQEQQFKQFLTTYTDSLNRTYCAVERLDESAVREHVRQFYQSLPPLYGLQKPAYDVRPKAVAFSALYSSVGVLGYMGPFFNEMQLNARLLPIQYPFTYAHELSHLLGVSNEAEANFWAYYTCTRSTEPSIRYSGYFGLFPYVVGSAQRLLGEADYAAWVKTVRTEVVGDFRAEREYWHRQYNPWIGTVQEWMYDRFLKANQIASGKKNYAEVIQMVMAFGENKE